MIQFSDDARQAQAAEVVRVLAQDPEPPRSMARLEIRNKAGKVLMWMRLSPEQVREMRQA